MKNAYHGRAMGVEECKNEMGDERIICAEDYCRYPSGQAGERCGDLDGDRSLSGITGCDRIISAVL
jgi:hypothetical protein